MTESAAKAVLAWVAGRLGGMWRIAEGPGPAGERRRKPCRLECGGEVVSIAFCQGATWADALDVWVASGSRWTDVPDVLKAGSAEELALKAAAAGGFPA